MPAPIVKRLNEEINRLLESPELRERLSGEALEPMPMSPEQFGQYIRDDIAPLVATREGAQHRNRMSLHRDGAAHTGHTCDRKESYDGPQHAGQPLMRTRRPSPGSSPTSSPRIRRRAGTTGVENEARRTFLNWVGCAIGGSRHATVEAALAAVLELAPGAQASILGRHERVDIASAALLNGITSHTFDFDDTHLRTIIHPAGPVASAALALAEHAGASGRELVDALVLGIEVSCRVGNAIYPEHYDRGWHITGSTGMLGAAAACARLLRLDAERTTMALGSRRRSRSGVREQFGTMTKPFHPGAAARAGSWRHCWPSTAIRPRRARSKPRAGSCKRTRPGTTGTKSPSASGSASRSRSTPTSRLPAGS